MKNINRNNKIITNNSVLNTPIETVIKKQIPSIINRYNKKPKIIMVSSYLLVFVLTVTTTILLLLSGNTNFKPDIFDPDANANIWNNYYEQHKKNHHLVNLNRAVNHFNKENISFSVTNQTEINYHDILNAIDSNLQTNKIEVKNNNIINDNLLPTGFFSNIIYNPAISFTINDTPLVNFAFKIPEIYDQSENYQLHFTTNNDSEAFGIAKENNTININVIVKNEVAINLNDIKLGNLDGIISVSNPKTTAVKDIVNSLTPTIKTAFTTALVAKLGIDPKKIIDDYYQIDFFEKDQSLDFTSSKLLNFTISTNSKTPNEWNFYGNCKGTISVTNTTVDLSTETTLSDNISNSFDESKNGTGIRVDIDNSKDKTNIDTKLTKKGLKSVNKSVVAAIAPTITAYFNQKFPTLAISNKDYVITINNLKQGADIFALTKGKILKISIKANNTYKLKGSLNTTVTIHGHNRDVVTKNYSNANLTFDGINIPNRKDVKTLQDNEQFYEQPNLFQAWISETNINSLLNNIKNNSYSIQPDSFTGNINIVSTLDTAQEELNTNVDISKIKNEKINNFYELLTQTNYIYLQTNVKPPTKDSNARTLKTVKIIFTNNVAFQGCDLAKITLYEITLFQSSIPIGTAITENAQWNFSKFSFDINYNQNN